jgi:hypothetical protein
MKKVAFMNMKHTALVTVCLLFLTSILEAQTIPDWVKNRPPRNTNETIYIVLEGTGETLEEAKSRAYGGSDIYGNSMISSSIGIFDNSGVNIQLDMEVGQTYFFLDLNEDEGKWFSNKAKFIDEFVTRNEGKIKYYGYYAIPRIAYNVLLEEVIYWYVPALKEGSIENAIYSAANQLASEIPKNLKVAVINVASTDNELGEFALEELTGYLSSAGIMQLFDRQSLASIRNERNFQMTADVDDNSAVSIGRFAGADVVVTGSITGSGSTRRLRFKALDVKTASILSQTSHRF